MQRSPGMAKDWGHLSSKRSVDSNNLVSVRSNTRFFKAVKEEGFENHHLSMPVSALKGVDLSNTPLNQIPFRLTQHPYVPFAISASDNAVYQEFNTKERERLKKEKIERFMAETQERVKTKAEKTEKREAKMLKKIEDHIKQILQKAIEFSLKTSMIDKSSKGVNHYDVAQFRGGPFTFNETDRDFRSHETAKSSERKKNVYLTELKTALELGLEKDEIIQIIDRIIDARDSSPQKLNGRKSKNDSYKFQEAKQRDFESPENLNRNETPEFDYTKLQSAANMFGIPPRDFKTYVPLLRILHLQNYDRNDFGHFDMVKNLKFLKHLWKTLDHKKINRMLNYEIVHEVMKIEERKAVRMAKNGKAQFYNKYRA